jgi:hypothetical protein
MDGIFLSGYRRPASKKAVKEAIAAKQPVYIEGTSMFGGYSGSVYDAPDGTYTFVGPDPYTNRKFYGNIVKRGDTIKAS